MSQETIKIIADAEEKARRIKADAAAEAKRMAAEAQAAGKLAVEAAEKKAQDELRELVRKADEKAKGDATALAHTTENKKASMRIRADSRMDRAAGVIVERIVNG